jgi:thioredoxin-related protein
MKMKTLIPVCIILFVLITQSIGQTPKLTVHEGDYRIAMNKAREENKFFLIDCYTDWCGWCKVMDKHTLTDTSVIQFLNEHYIFCKLDMEKPENALLHAKYRVSGFPGYMIFNHSGERVYQFTGYYKPEGFMKQLTDAMNPEHQMKFPGISKELNPGFPQEYIALFGTKEPPYYKKEVADSLLQLRSNLFDEVSWAILYKMRTSHKYMLHVLDNYNEYHALYGEEAKQYLDNYTDRLYFSVPDSNGAHELNALMAHIDKYYLDTAEAQEFKSYYKKEYFIQQKKWDSVQVILNERWEEYTDIGSNEINSDAWSIYLNCDDIGLLEFAERKMSQITQKEPDYFYLDTQGALLSKLGKYSKAIETLNLAIQKGKEVGEDTQSTLELLEKAKSNMKKRGE